MTTDPSKQRAASPSEEAPEDREDRPLTVDDVKDAVRKAAAGADELNQELKDVFGLTDASAALRLRER